MNTYSHHTERYPKENDGDRDSKEEGEIGKRREIEGSGKHQGVWKKKAVLR